MKEASYRTTSFSKRPNMRSNTNIESTASVTTFTAMKKSFNDSGHTITCPIAMDPNPYPLGGKGSWPWESLARILPSRRWTINSDS